jgi:glucose-6-phosphate isomerase
LNALKKDECTVNFRFLNNIDPDDLKSKLWGLDLKDSLFHIVSKSGKTAETLAAFSIIANKLSELGIDKNSWKDFFVFTTDPKDGHLRELAETYSIRTLEIPKNIGGRFSVLSPVGFLPSLFAGVDVNKLVSGAKASCSSILNRQDEFADLQKVASIISQLYQHKNTNQTVLMPYSSKLKTFSDWFVQLWAESLGKQLDRKGNEIFSGLTPISSYGATDQHSQVQLFMEGPKDKLIFLLTVKEFQTDYALKSDLNLERFVQLNGKSLAQLMKAERMGTLKALETAKRPFIELEINKLDEQSIAYLVVFFESLTALMGEVLNIDAFNQPGVEAGKKYAFEFLGKL